MLHEPFTLPSGKRVRGHGHALIHVCLIDSGGFRERLPTSARECGAGTVRVSPGGTAHSLDVWDGGAAGDILELPAALTSGLAAPVAASAYLHPDAIASPRDRLRIAAAGDDAFAIECAALELVARSLHATVRPDPPRWLRDLRADLDDAPPASPSLRACARRHERHASHTARAFRAWFGRSLGAHLRARRLAEAASLLREPGAELAALAADLGYADQAHFTRAFRARYGLSPGRFRRLVRGARATPVQDTGPARGHAGSHPHALGRSP